MIKGWDGGKTHGLPDGRESGITRTDWKRWSEGASHAVLVRSVRAPCRDPPTHSANWYSTSPSTSTCTVCVAMRRSLGLLVASSLAAAQRESCECRGQSPVPVNSIPGMILDRTRTAHLANMMHKFDGRKEWRKDWLKHIKRDDPASNEACTICTVTEDIDTLPQNLGVLTGTQLLVDDYVLASTHGVERFIAEPQYHPQPVMTSSHKFEVQGRYGFGYPGSVHHNGTHFIMHYIAGQAHETPRLKHGHGKYGSMAVAVSGDGFDWSYRKALKFYSPENANGGEHCVLHDVHERDPALRWKMVHNCNLPPIDETCLATSADGITWTSKGHKWGRNTDRQSCLYHDKPGGDYDYMLPDEFATRNSFRDIRGLQLNHVGEAEFHQSLMDNGSIPFKTSQRWHLDQFKNEKVTRWEIRMPSCSLYLLTGARVYLRSTSTPSTCKREHFTRAST